jgi:hypothetical protein
MHEAACACGGQCPCAKGCGAADEAYALLFGFIVGDGGVCVGIGHNKDSQPCGYYLKHHNLKYLKIM